MPRINPDLVQRVRDLVMSRNKPPAYINIPTLDMAVGAGVEIVVEEVLTLADEFDSVSTTGAEVAQLLREHFLVAPIAEEPETPESPEVRAAQARAWDAAIAEALASGWLPDGWPLADMTKRNPYRDASEGRTENPYN